MFNLSSFFKISRGYEQNLPTEINDGEIYFTFDSDKLFIDEKITDNNGRRV